MVNLHALSIKKYTKWNNKEKHIQFQLGALLVTKRIYIINDLVELPGIYLLCNFKNINIKKQIINFVN